MDTTAVALALTAGMVAAFNPCGFALVPAYLALFIGESAEFSRPTRLARALQVGLTVTLGFVVVFVVAAVLISAFAVHVAEYTPYATVILGPVLIGLGLWLWLLMGRSFSVQMPRISRKVGSGPGGMVSYGVIYATVSLSCTLPVFMVAVIGSFQADSFVSGVVVLLAYAIGMGLVLTALAVAVAFASDAVLSGSRRMVPLIGRISGVLLIVAGCYVTWYGIVELRVLAGDTINRGPVDIVASWSGSVSTFVDARTGLVVVLATFTVVAAIVGLLISRRKPRVSEEPSDRSHAVSSGGTE